MRNGDVTIREDPVTTREGEATVREGLGQSRPSDARSQEERSGGWLPESLAVNWRIAKSLPTRGGEAALYVLEPRDMSPSTFGKSRRVAKVYHYGIAPKDDVITRVQEAHPSHVVRIEASGQDAGRWWELMEYVEGGSLSALIEQEGPKLPDDLIREILVQLNEALAGLHKLPVEHRDLKPANVLVRSRTPLDLIVTDFGISSLMDESHHITRAAQTIEYAPPESIGTTAKDRSERGSTVMVEHTKWDYWSLGMMLVEMLQGSHPYDGLKGFAISHQLITQNVDQLTEEISDPDWRKLCRGLLRRTPSTRWDAEAVSKWLANPSDPSLVVAEETAEAQVPPKPTIAFDGARYATPAELGEDLSWDWSKAESFWKRRFGDVRTWVLDELGLKPLGDALTDVDDSDAPLDSQVFSFIYLLAPNAPLRFRNTAVGVGDLAALGERAVDQGDTEAGSSLLALYNQRILAFASSLPGQQGLAEVLRRWNEAVADYGRKRDELQEHGVTVPEPSEDQLIRLLAASTPGSPIEVRLRAEAHREVTNGLRRCNWFRELGTPEEMSVATLCMLPHLLEPAGRQGRLDRARRIRGCVAGMIIGGLYWNLATWAEGAFSPVEFRDSLGGALLLLLVLFASIIAIPWYRGGIREAWEWLNSTHDPLGSLRSGGRSILDRNF